MDELKPCPFCGTPYPYVTFEKGYIDESAIVFCNACKISVKLEENDQEGFNVETKQKAIEAWNRRTERSGKWFIEEKDSIYGKKYILTCSECGDIYSVSEDALPYEKYCRKCGSRNRGVSSA